MEMDMLRLIVSILVLTATMLLSLTALAQEVPAATDVLSAWSAHNWLALSIMLAQLLLLAAHQPAVNDWLGNQKEWAKPLIAVGIALLSAVAVAVPTKAGLQVTLINWGMTAFSTLLAAYTVYFKNAGKVVVKPSLPSSSITVSDPPIVERDTTPTGE
jgi:hypothetical protein